MPKDSEKHGSAVIRNAIRIMAAGGSRSWSHALQKAEEMVSDLEERGIIEKEITTDESDKTDETDSNIYNSDVWPE